MAFLKILARAILVVFYLAGPIFVLTSLSCARFRVKELKAQRIFVLPIRSSKQSNPDMQLQAFEADGLAYNLPLIPAVSRSKLYVSDPGHQLVRVFSDDQGLPELVLGTKRPVKMDKEVVFKKIDLQIPGWIAVDDEENMYIQSYLPIPREVKQSLPPEKRLPGRQSRIIQSPSVILYLNQEGNLQGKIGQNGFNSDPFHLIIKMYPDRDGRLNVLHRDLEGIALSVFTSGKFIRRFTMPSLNEIKAVQDTKQYLTMLETILPVRGKDFVIGCVVIRKKSNFDIVERVIYSQESPQSKAYILLRNDNPRDFLTWADNQRNFYMLQARESGSGLLLKVFDRTGEYLNNHHIYFPSIGSFWRDTFFNLRGRLFTSQVWEGKFIVYEWQ